jgi:RNA polymerase sigma-70 factor (ECF subfamily)
VGEPETVPAGQEAALDPPRGRDAAESALLERLAAGDGSAFAELVECYQRSVFALAYAFFRDRDDALEIVQEAFMRIHDKIGALRPEQSLPGWIRRLTHNLCVDRYRSQARQRRRQCGLEDVPERHFAVLDGPAQEWGRRRRQEAIERALGRLSPRQRSVFVLKYRQGLKLPQVAETMAISLGTVKALHHRALRRVRRELEPWSGGEHESMS